MSDIASPAARGVAPFLDFVALLRANGFAVAPEQTTAFLAAIALLGPRDPEDIRQAGLATLAPPPERHAAYDLAFASTSSARSAGRCRKAMTRTSVRVQEDQRGEDDPPDRRRSQRVRARRRRAPRRWSSAASARPQRARRCAASRAKRARRLPRGAATAACARGAAPWSTCAARCATARATTARSSSSRASSAACGRARSCCSSTSPAR